MGSSAAHTLAACLPAHTPAKRRRARSREDRLGRKSPVNNWAIFIYDSLDESVEYSDSFGESNENSDSMDESDEDSENEDHMDDPDPDY